MNNADGSSDEKLTKAAKRALDQSVENLDPATIAAIGQLKYHALNRNRSRFFSFLTWGSAAATVAALALFFVLHPTPRKHDIDLARGGDDLQLLMVEDAIEFYSKDLEFYEWLSDVLDKDPDYIPDRGAFSPDATADRFVGTGAEGRPSTQHGAIGVSGSFRG